MLFIMKDEQFRLSPEQQKMVADNFNLVRYLVSKKVSSNSNEFDDMVQVGAYGLIKAVVTFDPSKGNQFSTYAATCIKNQIGMDYRKKRKYLSDVSLQEELPGQEDIRIEDRLADSITSNFAESFVENIANMEAVARTVSNILNTFNTRDRFVMLLKIAGKSQQEIADRIGISQAYISRLEQRYEKRLNEKAKHKNDKQHREVFQVTMENNMLKIVFSTTEVVSFKKNFARFLLEMSSPEQIGDLTEFKIVSSKERVTIYLPAETDSFALLATLFKEIEDFQMKCVTVQNASSKPKEQEIGKPTEVTVDTKASTKNATPTESVKPTEPSAQKEESDTNGQEDDGEFENIEATEQEEQDEPDAEGQAGLARGEEPEVNCQKKQKEKGAKVKKSSKKASSAKKENQSAKIREYISTRQSFTVKELVQEFPDTTQNNVSQIINKFLKENRITRIGRGEYQVNSVEN